MADNIDHQSDDSDEGFLEGDIVDTPINRDGWGVTFVWTYNIIDILGSGTVTMCLTSLTSLSETNVGHFVL